MFVFPMRVRVVLVLLVRPGHRVVQTGFRAGVVSGSFFNLFLVVFKQGRVFDVEHPPNSERVYVGLLVVAREVAKQLPSLTHCDPRGLFYRCVRSEVVVFVVLFKTNNESATGI